VFSGGKLPETLKKPHQEIKETHRSEEEIGAEKREIDNSKKRIWQHGIITLHDERGGVSEWPFKLVVGITFDQTQVDQS